MHIYLYVLNTVICTHAHIHVITHNLLMFRYSGFSTEGEIDRVRLVGPRAPQTYRGIPEARHDVHSLHTIQKS